MKHEMHLNKGPFQKIWDGTKTVELRLLEFEMVPLTKCRYEQDDIPKAYLHMEEYPGYS